VAEDLLAQEPASDAHRQRLLRAFDMLGVDPAEALARVSRPDTLLTEPLDLSLDETVEPERPAQPAPPVPVVAEPIPPPIALDPLPAADTMKASASPQPEPVEIDLTEKPATGDDDTIVLDTLEVDLSETLATLGAASPVLPPPPTSPGEDPVEPPRDLESVFEEMRARTSARDVRGGSGDEVYQRAQEHLQAGRWADAVNDLETAARTPALRFLASAQLGRLYAARGEFASGAQWLERAAEAPAAAAEDATAVLYDLACLREKMGEGARALAIFMEILVDAGSYRDVSDRVDRLSRVQTQSPGA
jgi:hypothetical protein